MKVLLVVSVVEDNQMVLKTEKSRVKPHRAL